MRARNSWVFCRRQFFWMIQHRQDATSNAGNLIIPVLHFGCNNRDKCLSKSQFSKHASQHLPILLANFSRGLKQMDVFRLRIVHLRATLYPTFKPSTTSLKKLDQYYSWIRRLQQIQDSWGLLMYTWRYQPRQDVQHCYTQCSKLCARHSSENASSEKAWRWRHTEYRMPAFILKRTIDSTEHKQARYCLLAPPSSSL